MAKVTKLDWFPLYIHRIKASSAWTWLPHIFGWYMRLLIEAADSERPGYLPNDPVRLCELANGWGKDLSRRPRNWKETASKFESAWASILRSKFLSTDDCLWIYNESSLEVISTQTQRLSRVRKVSFSLSTLPIDEIYESYPRKLKPETAKTAIQKAIQRAAKTKNISELDAAQFILLATKEFAASPAGHKPIGQDFRPHPASWFNGGGYDEDRTEWYKDEANGQKEESPNSIAIKKALARMVGGEVDGSQASVPTPGT